MRQGPCQETSGSFSDYLSLMLSKPRISLSNPKLRLKFPRLSLNPIIESFVTPRYHYTGIVLY